MKHLLNCRECDWNEIVEGCSAVADAAKESHERSIRNRMDPKACPKGSVAWVTLGEQSEVGQ